MMLKPKQQEYSVEEYFALEEVAKYRSEYCDGEIFTMTGSSANHNRIQDTIVNPLAIIEVLSESTRDYDRGSKFAAYRNIATLREYILIDQDEIHIEAFVKDDAGTWRLRDYFEQDEVLPIESRHLTFPIQQLYKRVKFPPKPRLRAIKTAKKQRGE